MTLQTIINSAVSIEASRAGLVASSMSRNGRLLTSSRNWGKPWQFTIVPKPYWRYSEMKPIMESLLQKDKWAEHYISFGQTPGSAWMIKNDGQAVFGASGVTVNAASTGTSLILNLGTANAGFNTGTVLFSAGDVIQPVNSRYPYVVTENVTQPVSHGSTDVITVPINRGLLNTGTELSNQSLKGGVNCTWVVKVTQLPTIQYMAGQLTQFTSEIELIESII